VGSAGNDGGPFHSAASRMPSRTCFRPSLRRISQKCSAATTGSRLWPRPPGAGGPAALTCHPRCSI